MVSPTDHDPNAGLMESTSVVYPQHAVATLPRAGSVNGSVSSRPWSFRSSRHPRLLVRFGQVRALVESLAQAAEATLSCKQ